MDAKQKLIKSVGGFTLLEMMVALAILAVGLLSLVGLFVSSISGTSQGGRMTQAVSLAQQKAEEFKSVPYDNINTLLGTEANLNVLGGNVSQPGQPAIFTRTSQVIENNTTLKLKTIKISVSWPKNTATDRDHEISVITKRASEK